jgi:hypothetical protein
MPGLGFEPRWDCSRGILSPLRLPFRHPGHLTSYRAFRTAANGSIEAEAQAAQGIWHGARAAYDPQTRHRAADVEHARKYHPVAVDWLTRWNRRPTVGNSSLLPSTRCLGGPMRRCKPLGGAILLLAVTVACAHAQPEVEQEARAQVAPELVGCSGYTAPAQHWTEPNRVWIQMKVLPDGSVETGSPRHRPTRHDRGGHSAVATALSISETCFFEPARLDEEPVATWTRVRFAFR